MPNSSYLCTAEQDSLYPSTTVAGFASATGVVAYDVRCVPLLWLALFRPADIRTQTIVIKADRDAYYAEWDPATGDFVEVPGGRKDEVVEAVAPLAAKDRALAQLDAALPALNRLFEYEGPLDDHAAMLREAVAAAPGGFVTIELDEIEALWEEGTFQPAIRRALASMEAVVDPESERAGLIEIAQLRAGRPFPPARMLLGEHEGVDDDFWNLSRLLGTGFSAVPWEPNA
ncbi:hypothetical protein [Glycomyces algeriensis]|uniref:Uncharacterized protein n=1 Tax=Glycomyces algeriensis TaxID=256037 RepID=A0A9W6LHU1_9ACTN|nr:hypothetical protein [Glycomyces algeriensis]MDA1364444.1 hypothetical protein [Glycomyces algeriensis]MDR7350477.1 hypothetical protein [Glycomyces algeriensis]GLI43184.1 hypothetical protein GALLR39Z86_30340 [Glycomyces algeriensis]